MRESNGCEPEPFLASLEPLLARHCFFFAIFIFPFSFILHFLKETFVARKKRLEARKKWLGLAGSHISHPHSAVNRIYKCKYLFLSFSPLCTISFVFVFVVVVSTMYI